MWERGENLYFSEVSRHCIDRLFCFYLTAFMTSGSKPLSAQCSQIYRFGKARRVKKILKLSLFMTT